MGLPDGQKRFKTGFAV